MTIRFTNSYTDQTSITVDGKQFLRVGSAMEWVAFVRAGYVVNSDIRPVKGNPPSYSLSLLIPELGGYVARLRGECFENQTTHEECVEFVNRHAQFFRGIAEAKLNAH